MRSVSPLLSWLLLCCLLVSVPGCGAGVIGGALFGGGGDTAPPISVPSVRMSLDSNAGPLVPASFVTMRVATIVNAELFHDPIVEFVWQEAPGGTVIDQQEVLSVEPVGGGFEIRFFMRTTNIVAAVKTISSDTEMDVDVQLLISRASEESGETEVVAAQSFRLWRSITLNILPNTPGGVITVPVSGGDVRCLVKGLPDLSLFGVIAEVASLDSVTGALFFSSATILSLTDQGNREAILDLMVPGLTYPNQSLLVVSSGRFSTKLPLPVYYRQEIHSVVQPRAVADGGELVSMNGSVVPYDFVPNPPELDFKSVEVVFHKGGRSTKITSDNIFPTLSSGNNIVLRTPPSPDGKPGPVTIELRLNIEGVGGSATLAEFNSDVFAYGASAVSFDPRGVGLREVPVSTAIGRLRLPWSSAPSGGDGAIVYADPSGIPFVQLYEGMGNGMLSRVGPAIRSGDRLNNSQRYPIDLVCGEFDGDDRGDLFILNRGNFSQSHTWLRGVGLPGVNLELAGESYRVQNGITPISTITGNWDGNNSTDLFLLGRATTGQANGEVVQTGVSGFIGQPLWPTPPANMEIACASTTDVDGDGFADIIMAGAGTAGSLVIAYGAGDGSFGLQRSYSLSAVIPVGTTPVGVHACGPGPEHDIVLVIGDVNRIDPFAPLMIVPNSGWRDYDVTAAFDVVSRAFNPSHTLVLDLDVDGIGELIVGESDGVVSVFDWQVGIGFGERSGAISGLGNSSKIYDLNAGSAVAGGNEAQTLVVTHEVEVGVGQKEVRLSTYVVDANGALIHPMAELPIAQTIENLAVGDLTAGIEDETVLALPDTLVTLTSDAIGQWTQAANLAVPDLVESSIHVIPRVDSSSLSGVAVFLTETGHVGVMASDGASFQISGRPLWEYRGDNFVPKQGSLLPESQIRAADVDGDGEPDLVILYVFETEVIGKSASLVILARGDDGGGLGVFPFKLPDPNIFVAEIDGPASSYTVGDFAPDMGGEKLEVAVAVGWSSSSKSGIYFFRYEASASSDASLVPSIFSPTEGLLATTLDPLLVRAVDLERDGLDDLAIVSDTFDAMYLLRQDRLSARPGDPGVVDPLAFSISAEVALNPGVPIRLLVGDIDQDRIVDFVVHVTELKTPVRQFVSVHISDGVGGIQRSLVVPEFRIVDPTTGKTHGNRLSLGLADSNRDGVPDLILGWDAATSGTGAVVQSLFGSYR